MFGCMGDGSYVTEWDEDQREMDLTEDLPCESTFLIMKVFSNCKDSNLRQQLKSFS